MTTIGNLNDLVYFCPKAFNSCKGLELHGSMTMMWTLSQNILVMDFIFWCSVHVLWIYPQSLASSHVYLCALIFFNMQRHVFYYYIVWILFKNVFGCCVYNIFPSFSLTTKFERQSWKRWVNHKRNFFACGYSLWHFLPLVVEPIGWHLPHAQVHTYIHMSL
jgi:hypothetical protein